VYNLKFSPCPEGVEAGWCADSDEILDFDCGDEGMENDPRCLNGDRHPCYPDPKAKECLEMDNPPPPCDENTPPGQLCRDEGDFDSCEPGFRDSGNGCEPVEQKPVIGGCFDGAAPVNGVCPGEPGGIYCQALGCPGSPPDPGYQPPIEEKPEIPEEIQPEEPDQPIGSGDQGGEDNDSGNGDDSQPDPDPPEANEGSDTDTDTG